MMGVICNDTGHCLPENAVHASRIADSIAGGKGAADLASFFIDEFAEVMPATMAARFDSLQGRDDAIGADAIDPCGVEITQIITRARPQCRLELAAELFGFAKWQLKQTLAVQSVRSVGLSARSGNAGYEGHEHQQADRN